MIYVSRERNSSEDIITESSKTLNFLYNFFLGRLLLKIVTTKACANCIALFMNSRISKCMIKKFISKNDINVYEYDDKKYKSYNDFFTRKVISVKRPIDANKNILISPCDSKVTAYRINDDLTLRIKDAYYSIDTLVDNDVMNEYKDGFALVFRLSTDDYHRYCYIDNGTKGRNYYINGILHTVQAITLKRYNFYKTNSREYTILNTQNFGKVIQVEIGALAIGRIHNNHQEYEFKKGEEKGYFEFGGSTIVLLFKKNTIKLDDDIYYNSMDNIETIVKYGQRIGKRHFFEKLRKMIFIE